MYKVLISEDEAIVRLGLKNMLDWESMEMQVTALAADGEEAWRLYCEGQPDIVVTDIRMPRLDGMELIRRIRRTGAKTKIIILTCIDDLAMVQQALEMGVTGYILKLTAGIEEVARLLSKAKAALDEEGIVQDAGNWIDMELLKQQVWYDFVVEHRIDAREFENFSMKAGLRLNTDALQVIVFCLPDCERLKNDEETDTAGRRKFVRDIVKNLLAKYLYGECILGKGREYSVLLSITDCEGDLCGEILQAVQQALYQHMGVHAICGISDVGRGCISLPVLYEQATAKLREPEKENDALPPRVLQALRYIRENFNREISLGNVAEAVGVSSNYLSHMFTKHLNISFTNYLNQIRIQHSKELLADPAKKVYEVSECVGFYSTAYFVRVFKNVTGQTPTEFRNGGIHAE